jgi:hypothetical protein
MAARVSWSSIASLMPQVQAAGNPVRFVSGTAVTNAAAATAAGQKPESAITSSPRSSSACRWAMRGRR